MNPAWQNFLSAKGAAIENGRVNQFGDPAIELQAAQNATVLCDLSHLGLLAFSGDDRLAFLHGQLTNDVRKITADTSQYGGYCSPRGRLLASFLLWQSGECYCMQLPGALCEPVRKRLAMFVLRSRVGIAGSGDDSVRLGLAGTEAAALLEKNLGSAPPAHGVTRAGSATILGLPGGRFEIAAPLEQAAALWEAFSGKAAAAGAPCWDWLEIMAAIPVILPPTQDHFVPQMVNLDLIGAVSFNKGCYPGQEIVARVHHLGKLKRRMYRGHISSGSAPNPADELFSTDMAEQASGTIVNCAPAPGGGFDVLAVIQTSSAQNESVHWKSPDGPQLKLLPLPY